MKQCILAGVIVLSMAACGGGGGGDGDGELSQSSASLDPTNASVGKAEGGVDGWSVELSEDSSSEGSISENSISEDSISEDSISEGSISEGSISEGSVLDYQVEPNAAEANSRLVVLPQEPYDGRFHIEKLLGLHQNSIISTEDWATFQDGIRRKLSIIERRKKVLSDEEKHELEILKTKYAKILENIEKGVGKGEFSEQQVSDRIFNLQQFIVHEIISMLNEKYRILLPFRDFRSIKELYKGENKKILRSTKRLIVLCENNGGYPITVGLRYFEESDANLKNDKGESLKGWYQISSDSHDDWKPLIVNGSRVDNVEWLENNAAVRDFMYLKAEELSQVVGPVDARAELARQMNNTGRRKLKLPAVGPLLPAL